MADRSSSGETSGTGKAPASSQALASGKATASGRTRSSTGGSSPERTPRAGRRAHDRALPEQRSFLERYRTALVVMAGVAIAGVLAGFLLVQTTAKAYACESILAPAAPSDPSALGQAASDLGRSHVPRGTSVRYAYCPPTSGSHYNDLPDGPIPAQFYAPDMSALPQGWIHNLEHGGVAVLYSCTRGSCSDAEMATLRPLIQAPPASPLCGRTDAILAARFDDLPTPYAVVAWDRVLFLSSPDVDAIKAFYAQRGDRGPEPQCAQAVPGASPTPAASAPAAPGSAAP